MSIAAPPAPQERADLEVRVIDSQALALVLLAALVVAIVVIAHRMHSETVGGSCL